MARLTKRPLGLALGVALSLTAVGGAALAAVSAEKVIAERQKGLKAMGGAFKTINDNLKTDAPDAKLIAAQAKIVKDGSHKIPGWFPKGSGPEAGFKTAAKPEIWTDGAKFAAAAKGLQVEAAKLETIAKGGNIDAIKAQVKATGGACGTCHTPFRVKS
ncbi:MAG: cytochrome c [Phenylobacterium sp.]|nr:cytochrome c [Phenylobacterium sp.]